VPNHPPFPKHVVHQNDRALLYQPPLPPLLSLLLLLRLLLLLLRLLRLLLLVVVTIVVVVVAAIVIVFTTVVEWFEKSGEVFAVGSLVGIEEHQIKHRRNSFRPFPPKRLYDILG
jgi:hypothetical protein